MASEVTCDDDYIVISELSDESGVDEKSAHAIPVSDSSGKQTLSYASCDDDKVKSDDIKTECHVPVQQTDTALQSTNEANVNLSCGSQNQSKHCKSVKGHVYKNKK